MQASSIERAQPQIRVNEFIRSVYNWMAIGLGITGLVAFYVANNQTLQNLIFGNSILFFGLIIAEFGLVFFISARIQKLNAATATSLFVLYAALNGATLSFVFLMYTSAYNCTFPHDPCIKPFRLCYSHMFELLRVICRQPDKNKNADIAYD